MPPSVLSIHVALPREIRSGDEVIRTAFYVRVLEEGLLQSGDELLLSGPAWRPHKKVARATATIMAMERTTSEPFPPSVPGKFPIRHALRR